MPRFQPAPLRRYVHQQATPRIVERPQEDTSQQYGTGTSYADLPEQQRILIIGSSESAQPTMAGERESAMLMAYTLPSENVQEGDRFTQAGTTYEVKASNGVPEGGDNAILIQHEIDNV